MRTHWCDKRFANAAPFLRAHRDILQIRVAASQTAGNRYRLIVAGVYTAGMRVNHLRQLVGVGRFELGEAAMLQNYLGQRVIQRQFLQHVFIGAGRAAGRFFGRLDAEFAEENLLQLLGRAEIERLFGDVVGLFFQLHQLHGNFIALAVEHVRVNQHAIALYGEQNLRNRHLDLRVDKAQLVVVLHNRRHRFVQLQRDVRIFRRIFAGLFNRDLIEADLLRTFAGDLFKCNRLDAQMALAQVVHAMVHVRFEYVGLQQGIMRHAAQHHAVISEYVHIVFQVLADFFDGFVFQNRLEFRQSFSKAQLVRRAEVIVPQRYVGGFARLDRKRDADDLRHHRVERGGFGVHANQLGAA